MLLLLIGFLLDVLVDLVVVAGVVSVPFELLPAAGPAAINIDSNPTSDRNTAPEGKNGELATLIAPL